MTSPLAWLNSELADLESRHLLRRRRQFESLPGGWCLAAGRRLRNFAGNDYLGLSHDPRLKAAAERALSESGSGAGARALVSGRSQWLVQLEEQLIEFEGCGAALVFPTGYAANLGTIAALADSEDVIYCDRFNHASLVDGCRLAGAKFRVYRHDALDKLDESLASASPFRRRFIVTDTVFSMEGDVAPLGVLVEIADRRDAILIVDEAHGTGVWGESGRGACEALGIADRVPVRIGTLSKAVGSLGGFVAGDQSLIDWLWNCGRTQIYSTALPPAVCAAAAEGLRIIAAEPQRRAALWRNCDLFRQMLQDVGLEPHRAASGPIVPLVLADAELAVEIAGRLEERGFLVGGIRPPTVPQGTSRLRITLSAVHDEESLVELVAAIHAVWPRFR